MCRRCRKRRQTTAEKSHCEKSLILSTVLGSRLIRGSEKNIVRQCRDLGGRGDQKGDRVHLEDQTERSKPDVEDNFRCLVVASWKTEHCPVKKAFS
jgi:hypothetical protein